MSICQSMLRASPSVLSFLARTSPCSSTRTFCSHHEAGETSEAFLDQPESRELTTHKVPDSFPEVPIIPITRYPFFPTFIKRIDLAKDDALKEAIRYQMTLKLPYAGVFLRKDDEKSGPITSLSELYNVGSFVSIQEFRDHDSIVEMVLMAHRRIRILEPLIKDVRGGKEKKKVSERKIGSGQGRQATQTVTTPAGIVFAKTENVLATPAPSGNETKALMQAIVQAIRDVVQLNPLFGQQINLLLHPTSLVIENPVNLCDLVASVVQSADTEELQAIMEECDVMERLKLTLELAEKEKTVAKMKHDLNKEVEKKVQDQHRKYLLMEQLKAIKKELGMEKDEKSTINDTLNERLKDLTVPPQAMKAITEERQKLSVLDPHSAEFSVTRNYLEWLTNMPWGKSSVENTDLEKAKHILDDQHFGMDDVKQRILEFISVNILRKKVGGKMICLYGPPGVGKTSIAKSIAVALNREYFRFAVGGMTDVAEIKGHRRTYVGSMPGKVIQGLKKVQTENPLILIDEVDKMGGAGFHGDPASALLELLDPEQNVAFNDHFLDVPVDLSRVLFVCTANEVDRLPGPLRDRMEIINVSGYLAEEKMSIAEKHLIPQIRADTSLTPEQLEIKNDALDTLVKKYCRESGVRNLKQCIAKIFSKVALKIASEGEGVEKVVVGASDLEEYMGKEKFPSDRLYDETPVGVVMGLAWTAMGGSALYVEAVKKRSAKEGVGAIEITGNMGDVMKESVRIAHTVAVKYAKKYGVDGFDGEVIHVHVPEGATPKDGPSAGVTIVSALLSLATDLPLPAISMTGEISLTGKVLAVGGIREKVIAARRVGVHRIILPEANKADVDKLPDTVKESLQFHFVGHYDQVVPIIFPSLVK